jgi:hypothetical protein
MQATSILERLRQLSRSLRLTLPQVRPSELPHSRVQALAQLGIRPQALGRVCPDAAGAQLRPDELARQGPPVVAVDRDARANRDAQLWEAKDGP